MLPHQTIVMALVLSDAQMLLKRSDREYCCHTLQKDKPWLHTSTSEVGFQGNVTSGRDSNTGRLTSAIGQEWLAKDITF